MTAASDPHETGGARRGESGRDVRALAVVIGRAGSKGLPGKNEMIIAGRPMIAHTIRHAQHASSVSRVVVSTDGELIARHAREMGVHVIMRPDELASDHARVADVVRHAIETDGGDEPIIVVLYANVPVRPADLIDRAIARLVETGADSVQSYAEVGKYHPAWMVRLDDDGRVVLNQPDAPHRRQDLPRMLIPDGGVIAVRRTCVLDSAAADHPHAFFGRDRRGIETESGSVIDVDTRLDAIVAEAVIRDQHLATGQTPSHPRSKY